jgi:hypothetical protein
MRVLVENYGDVRIFYDRPYGYKRYIVEWSDSTQTYSGLWYKEKDVRELVERRLHFAKGE